MTAVEISLAHPSHKKYGFHPDISTNKPRRLAVLQKLYTEDLIQLGVRILMTEKYCFYDAFTMFPLKHSIADQNKFRLND